MRLVSSVLLILAIATLMVGCGATEPELPACPGNSFDAANQKVSYVHDDGDGEFYLIEYYVDSENVTALIAELAVDIINPLSVLDIGRLVELLAEVEIDANLDITPCEGAGG